MSDNTIKLNPAKPSTLEFEVMVSGLEGVPPTVRFVIQNVLDGVDWVVNCTKLAKTKWQAAFPALTGITADTADFVVEVIVDEYYFKPAEGKIHFVNTPDVSFTPKVGPKPSVTTSFTVKQDEEKPPVKESAGGGEITGQFAPTNDLLQVEEDPEAGESHVKVAQAELDDQYIDQTRIDDIADEIQPGEGKQYAQDDGKEDEFDPKKVAESILQQSFGLGVSHRGVEKRGSLFKRDASGKAIVPGLENPAQKKALTERDQKVKEILRK